MNVNVQLAIAIIILIVGTAYLYHIYQTKQDMRLHPIYVNQNFVSINHSPTTTNIENMEGNGHTIGNENTVKNEIA